MLRRLIVATVLTGAANAILMFTTASAAVPPAGGPIELYATAGDSPVGTIVVAGAIGDYGKTLSMDKNGKPDTNGNFVKITLKQGTFMVDSTILNQKTAKLPPTIANKTSCSFAFTGSGPVTLSHGTGLYTGISGTVSITINFIGDGPFYASGKKKGQCNLSNNGKPRASRGWIMGHGTVKFS
jgi:hypothetical protein